MIRQVDRMQDWLKNLGWELTIPEFEQTLTEAELLELVHDFDGWIIGDDPATEAVFRAGKAGRLRAAVKWGAGVDNIDFEGAKNAGIPISHTPGTFGGEVSDVAIGYLIGLARGLFQIDQGVRAGHWPKPAGMSLTGKSVGVLGLGHIGRCLVPKLKALGMDIVGYDPFVTETDTPDIGRAQWPQKIDTLNFVILTCNLTDSNFHIINTAVLDSMNPSAYLINVSRGGLVDESALIQALQGGQIQGAALEVMEHEPLPANSPLRKMDNVVFGSHNSSNTIEAVLRTSRIAIDKLSAFLEESA
ncbi:MAG: phosphoglycerate dehydrogenase [Opitutales bacterium]|nr:phosphoglycerate dehydrogenase [Opitutales bacterium]